LFNIGWRSFVDIEYDNFRSTDSNLQTGRSTGSQPLRKIGRDVCNLAPRYRAFCVALQHGEARWANNQARMRVLREQLIGNLLT
jgi:hypothetical protein